MEIKKLGKKKLRRFLALLLCGVLAFSNYTSSVVMAEEEHPEAIAESIPEITVNAKEGTAQKTFDGLFYCDHPTVTVTDDAGGTLTVTVKVNGKDDVLQTVESGGSVNLDDFSGDITINVKNSAGGETSKRLWLNHYPGGRYTQDVEATCTQSSLKVTYWICKYCGVSYDSYASNGGNPALGHQFDTDPSKQEKFTPCGGGQEVTVSPCTRCGVMVTENGQEYTNDNSTHQWGDAITVEPTCTSSGYQYQECQKCHIKEKISGSDKRPLGHKYGAWVTKGEDKLKCGEKLVRVRTCMNKGCDPGSEGHTQEQTYTQLHDYFSKWQVIKAATCDTPGYSGYKCLNCDEIKDKQEIPALGHEYIATSGDCTKGETCNRCGAVKEGYSGHTLVWKFSAKDMTHWQACSNAGCTYKTNPESHKGIVNGDCTKQLICECGYWVNGQSNHTWEYTSDENFHWMKCTTPGCTVETTKYAHSFPSGDCTKPQICSVCGRNNGDGESAHAWGEYIHTISHHYQICTNPGCNQRTSYGEHTLLVDRTDCTKNIYCTECGYISIHGNLNHNYGSEPWQPDASDPNHHYRECINGKCEVREYAAHTGGEATCTEKAQCTECHAYYGEVDKDNHTGPIELEHGYKEPTFTEAGYSGDKYCSSCQTVIEKGHVLPPLSESHVHTYGEQKFDEVESWYECTECGYRDRVTKHTFNGYLFDGENGHYQQCQYCKFKTTTHPHSASPEKYDNDCTTAVTCDNCGHVIVDAYETHDFSGGYAHDESGHWQICTNPDCAVTSTHVDHAGTSDLDCTTADLCSVCGYTMQTAEASHNWDSVWMQDKADHYRKCLNEGCEAADRHKHNAVESDHLCTTPVICADCGFVIEEGKSEHAFGGDYLTNEDGHWLKCQNPDCLQEEGVSRHTGGKATCASKALCTVCGVEYGEIDSNNHIGLTELRDHENPTETEWGFSGNIYCLGCDQIIEHGTPIPPLMEGHEHYYAEKSDDSHHWQECLTCGAITESEEHTLEWMSDETSHYEKCTKCSYVRVEPEAQHVPAHWSHNETDHWRECEICGYLMDNEKHADGILTYDNENHWYVCPTCGGIFGQEAHTFDGRWCSVCGTENINFVPAVSVDTPPEVGNKDAVQNMLETIVQELYTEDSALSEKIIEAVNENKDINVQLVISDAGITGNVKKLDISILVFANKDLLGNITEVKTPIEFAIPLNDLTGRIFRVYRIHEGEKSYLDSRVENGKIYFCSDKFSEYYIEGSNNIVFADVEAIPDQTYTGSEIKPSVKVTINGSETLKEGVDYELSYENNVEAGTATIIITGKGEFAGSVQKVTFTIIKLSDEGSEGSTDSDTGNNTGKAPDISQGDNNAGNDENKTSVHTPRTGDMDSPGFWLLMMLLSVCVFGLLLNNRKHNRKL